MKNLILAGISLILSLLLNAQTNFYNTDSVQFIEITFTQTNWDYMLDTCVSGADGYVIAQSVSINGQVFDSVGVKYKGNSSYNANQVKNPLHIELDHIRDNQSYNGYSDIKLSNGFKDPSFCREVLSYNILNKYMHAPQANYVWLKINGNVMGLYSSAEHIGNKFVSKHFYSSGNAFFKCNPPAGAGPGTTATPSLVYLGSDSSDYFDAYEMKSDYGWNELVAFTDSLANQSATIANHLDIDRVLWMLAFNNIFVNLDSYTGGFSQNYYLYKDQNNRFNPVVWDLNESFGCFTNSGSGNLSTTQMQQMSPLLHETNSSKPLIKNLFSNPEYKRRYMAHFRTMLSENFSNELYLSMAQTFRTLVDTWVSADPNKLFTYTQFQNALTTQINSPTGSIPGIQQLMSARNTWLQSQSIFTAAPPPLTSNATNPANPALGQEVTITCQASGASLVRLGFRDATWKKFNYIQMYDDGNHDDGASADGTYGAKILVSASLMQYYIYAENSNAGIFLPARAEHEFFEISAQLTTPVPGEIFLNEFMAVNQSDTTDSNGANEDWIELVNMTTNPLSLDGLFLTDDETILNKWEFPVGTIIPANGYLFIWADEDEVTGEIHTNFKLSSGGEVIYLSDNTGLVLDSVIFGAQTADQSVARCPNGTGAWQATPNSTPAYANSCEPEAINFSKSQPLKLYPNPASSFFCIENDGTHTLGPWTLYDFTGREVLSGTCIKSILNIETQGQKDGFYSLRLHDSNASLKLIIRH